MNPGILSEVETFSKPGTADVTPGDRKKLAPLIKHYAAQAHPFTACKRDQLKHGLSEDHANRRCAVLKKLSGREAQENCLAIILEAEARIEAIAEVIGEEAITVLVSSEEAPAGFPPRMEELVEEVHDCSAVLEHLPPLLTEAYSPPAWAVPKGSKSITSKGSKIGGKDDPEFEKKHPRGKEGTREGGKFVQKGAGGSGSGGSDVVEGIQKKLGISTTGTFNEITRRRVIEFQENHGLKVDGIVGRQTATALLGGGKVSVGALGGNLRKRLAGIPTKKSKESDPGVLAESEEDRLLAEKSIRVSGYVTKSGKHVGSYSQVRKLVSKLEVGQSLELPEGISVTRHESGDGFSVHNPHGLGGVTHRVLNAGGKDPVGRATKSALNKSAMTDHPKSIGGTTKFKDYAKGEKLATSRPEVTPGLTGPGELKAHRNVAAGKRPDGSPLPGAQTRNSGVSRGPESRDDAGTMDARDASKGMKVEIDGEEWEVLGKTKGGDVQVKARGAYVPKTIYGTTSVKPIGRDFRKGGSGRSGGGKYQSMKDASLISAAVQQKKLGAGLPSPMVEELTKRGLMSKVDAALRKAKESDVTEHAPGILAQEETVDVARRTRDDGTVTATYESVRSALWDLERESSKTTEVRLPHGVSVTSRKLGPPPERPYGMKRTEFTVKGPDGRSQKCENASEAAEYAKDWDVEASSKARSAASA